MAHLPSGGQPCPAEHSESALIGSGYTKWPFGHVVSASHAAQANDIGANYINSRGSIAQNRLMVIKF